MGVGGHELGLASGGLNFFIALAPQPSARAFKSSDGGADGID